MLFFDTNISFFFKQAKFKKKSYIYKKDFIFQSLQEKTLLFPISYKHYRSQHIFLTDKDFLCYFFFMAILTKGEKYETLKHCN